MIFISMAWWIPGTIVEILVCMPIKRAWAITTPGHCIRFGTFWILIVTGELCIDVTILVLPIREVIKLKISWKQKILISMMFLLGGM